VPVPTAADDAADGADTTLASGRAPVVVRCESCGEDVVTRHAFDKVECSCGDVTVSGRPWRPTVTFRARAGSGWHEVAPDADADRSDDIGADAASDESPPRPLGYRP
jgi:hypothetical protein